MTISRKRTAGAAFAGSALVFGAVFTPVAAFAADEPTAPVEDLVDAQDVSTSVSVEFAEYAQAATLDGVNYSGGGFEPGAEYTLSLTVPGSGAIEIDGTHVADADGNIAGNVYLYEVGSNDPILFPLGDYELVVTQVVDAGTNTASAYFVVNEEGVTEDSEPTDGEAEESEPTDGEAEDSEPTDGEAEDSEPTDGEVADEQSLVVEQDSYTVAESIDGVSYQGAGFAPNTDFKLWVILPGDIDWTEVTYTPEGDVNEQLSDGEGFVAGTLNYFNLDTGAAIEFPEGAYQIRVTQELDGETLSAEASFTVGDATVPTEDEDDPEETAVPTKDESDDSNNSGDDNKNNSDDQLAQTGADEMLPVFLAGGLVLMAAGAGLFVVRRRMEA